jgi:hypothetical protein
MPSFATSRSVSIKDWLVQELRSKTNVINVRSVEIDLILQEIREIM